MLIADAVSVSGSMKMVPFYRDEEGWLSHTDPYSLTIHQPAGWMADVQAMDDREIADRPPGKYYRVFEKSPTAAAAKPLFVGFAMRGGAGSWFWGMDGKSATTPLGPASVNRVVSSQSAGQFHELSVQFTTDLATSPNRPRHPLRDQLVLQGERRDVNMAATATASPPDVSR